jgi:hypothetical protein
MTIKKPRLTKTERDRLEVEATCAEFAAVLKPLVGFVPGVEPVQKVYLKRGGAISLGTVKVLIAGLKRRA